MMRKSMGLMSSGHLVTMTMLALDFPDRGSLSRPAGSILSSYMRRLMSVRSMEVEGVT